MDIQASEYASDLRIKFASLGDGGQLVSDTTETDYEKFFERVPDGWQVRSIREIHTRSDGQRRARVLAKGETELAAVEHETGVEFLVPVAQSVAAGLGTSALEGLLTWAWQKWGAIRQPPATADGSGQPERCDPTLRLETATTANGARKLQRQDFSGPVTTSDFETIVTSGLVGDPTRAKSMSLAEVRTGRPDKRGLDILDVYWAVADYKIYRTERGISPHFSDDEEKAGEQRQRYMNIGPQLSRLNGMLNVGYIGDAEPFFNREIARAVAQALEGNAAKAAETLTQLEARASKSWQISARTEYITACGVVTLLATLAWLLRLSVGQGLTALPVLQFQVMALGAWGAFLSVAIGLSNLEVDPHASSRYNLLTGVLRILVGMLGAMILYFVLMSEVFSNLVTSASAYNDYAIYVLSVVAGFSERMVPSILDQVAKKQDEKPDKGEQGA